MKTFNGTAKVTFKAVNIDIPELKLEDAMKIQGKEVVVIEKEEFDKHCRLFNQLVNNEIGEQMTNKKFERYCDVVEQEKREEQEKEQLQ